MLQISVMGPLEVTRDGQPVNVPGGKTSEVLVRLALEAGVFLRADRLVEDVWGQAAVHTRLNTLQSKIAKLRRALVDPQAIVSGPAGYALNVEPSAVDALVVIRDATTAARSLDRGGDREAAVLSASTLALFRGEVLAAAGGGAWADPHRARLEEARAQLLETQYAARLRLGDAGDLVGELEVAVGADPYQEGLWELLITALYQAGRQAEALATYQRCRSKLLDELGLDPGPRLRGLEQQILRHDPVLHPGRAVRRPAPHAQTGNLPSMSVELVGRETEIAELTDLLHTRRLVEIIGPGGIGKTAVALETGRRLAASQDAAPGGVWFVRLEAATTADDVLDTVIAALGVAGGASALLERLKGPAAVVILDNCEHVLDAAANLAQRLLDATTQLCILCTSQMALDIDGETLLELQPLPLADAVELFTRRAAARRGDRSTPRADAAVQELCRSLDGLPLAIELAAARTRTLSVQDITRRLDDRFSVLSDPTSRRPERRRALKATIGWSYELLFPDDQRGLWALATFADGAPLPAVESVLESLDVPAATAIDVVGRLASRSLVIADANDAAAPIRYRLLDSIRAFALEAMHEAGLAERARAAHAAWFAAAAESSTRGVRSAQQTEHLSFARKERANIDAALAWCTTHDPARALDLVNGFGWAWIVLGDSRGAQRIRTALDVAPPTERPRDRASALLLAAWLEASTDQLQLAHEHIAAASALAQTTGDIDLQARCCYYLAYVVSHEGQFSRALELTDRSDTLYAGLDRPWDQAANWLFAARAAISSRDQARSVAARDQVEHWLTMVEDPWLQVRREAMLGELARIEHRFADAVLHIGRAAQASGRLGFLQTEAYQVFSLGRAQCQAGDYPTGAATLRLAIEKADATGDARLAALARVHLGRVLRALGQDAQARNALEAASGWHRAAGGGEQAALGDCLLAAMDADDGISGADHRLRTILDTARRQDDAPVEVVALDALARIATNAGDVDIARDLRDRADGRMHAASHFITERDRIHASNATQPI